VPDDSNAAPQDIFAKVAASDVVLMAWLMRGGGWLIAWVRDIGVLRLIRVGPGVAGVIGIVYILRLDLPVFLLSRVTGALATGACLATAGLGGYRSLLPFGRRFHSLPRGALASQGCPRRRLDFVLSAIAVVLAWTRRETGGG
jgi:hypothetical protein